MNCSSLQASGSHCDACLSPGAKHSDRCLLLEIDLSLRMCFAVVHDSKGYEVQLGCKLVSRTLCAM